jgi:hypothetical protein
VLGASILKLATTVLEQFFLGVNRPGAVAIATFGGVAINAAAAWILIMGRLGLRPMGVTGSAIAQNIGVGVEGLIVLLFLSSATLRKTYGLRAWRLNPGQMWTLIKVGVPVRHADRRRHSRLVRLHDVGNGRLPHRGDGRQHFRLPLHVRSASCPPTASAWP